MKSALLTFSLLITCISVHATDPSYLYQPFVFDALPSPTNYAQVSSDKKYYYKRTAKLHAGEIYPRSHTLDGCDTNSAVNAAEEIVGIFDLFSNNTEFTDACNNHDVCYTTLGKARSSCDSDFYTDLKAECVATTNNSASETLCIASALGIYQAVRSEGLLAFNNAQQTTSDRLSTAAWDDSTYPVASIHHMTPEFRQGLFEIALGSSSRISNSSITMDNMGNGALWNIIKIATINNKMLNEENLSGVQVENTSGDLASYMAHDLTKRKVLWSWIPYPEVPHLHPL